MIDINLIIDNANTIDNVVVMNDIGITKSIQRLIFKVTFFDLHFS